MGRRERWWWMRRGLMRSAMLASGMAALLLGLGFTAHAADSKAVE